MAAQTGSSFIDGIGDEVVLFGIFICVVVTLLCLVIFRTGRTGQSGRHNDGQQGDEAVVIENQDEGQDDSVEDSLHQRSSMTPERLKLYLVTQERTRTVFVSRNATLEELKRTYFSDDASAGYSVRFIYQGRILQETDVPLIILGIQDQTSVHVHIRRDSTRWTGGQENRQFDISILFFPLFTIILLLCWAGLLYWPHAFTLFPKLLLFVLSVGFAYLYYRSHLP